MSDPLRGYLVGRGLATDPEAAGERTPRLTATGGIPIRVNAFFESLGVAPFSRFEDLKPELQAKLVELQPAVERLGPKFDYNRLVELAEQGGDKLDPETRFKMMGVATLGLNQQIARSQQASKEGMLVAANEFARQIVPVLPKIEEETLENLTLDPQGVAVAKAVGSVAGILVSGKLVYTALSKTTLLPKIGPLIQQIPQRTREIVLGIGTGATLDAARPDGLPEDPANIDLSARLAHPVADALGGGEVAERVALGISGGVVGGVVGAALLPILRGIQKGREIRLAAQFDDATVELMRQRLQAIGVAVESGETKQATVMKALQNMDKISMTEKMAQLSALDETRMDYVLNQLFTDPNFNGADDLRYMAGVFRANPGGMSVVRGVKDPKVAEGLINKMGLNVAAIRVKDDLLIMRPQVVFPEVGVITPKLRNHMDDFTEQVQAINAGRPATRLSILPDGRVVKGEYNAADMANRFKLKPPMLEEGKGYDFAVREHLGMIDVKVEEGGALTILLPTQVTRRQANILEKMADRGPTSMRLVSTQKEKVAGPVAPPAPTAPGTAARSDVSGLTMEQVEGELRRAKTKLAMLKIDASHGPASAEGNRLEMEHWSNYVKDLNKQAERLESGVPPAAAATPVPTPPTVTTSAPIALVPKERLLENPFGMQVEDALADLVQGASKPKLTAEMVKRAQQFQKEGVFSGQAAVLGDGYPVEIIRRVGKKIAYRDPITGAIHRIPADNLTILPTSLEGELKPSRQIFEAMDEGEKLAFAKLRRGINEGLAKPIVTVRDLESFAASRGKFVSAIGRGRVRVHDPNTGESRVFDNIKAATTYLRGSLGPLPDLTPPEIEQLLGYKPNLGGMSSGGPPARLHEPIPITEDEFNKAASEGTLGMLPPGMVEQWFVPTRGLMVDLSAKYNMPFDKVFSNIQTGVVHRQNFVAAWINGEGPGLPDDIMPLLKIYKLAGKPNAGRQELMMDWLESQSDDIARKAIEAQLTPNELAAAKEARKFFGVDKENGLFKVLDVEAEWLTDYAPHLRQQAEVFGGDIVQAWRLSKGTPLPKSVPFWADFTRDGSVDLYDKRLFVVMAKYVEAGARARYLNAAMSDAKRLIRAIPDNAVKTPLVNYIEAIRGSEFTAQRAALDASFSNILHSLGADERIAKDLGERLSMALLGMSYQATMAFRPGLAVRNATQIFQTSWPLLGSTDDVFTEAIGRALSRQGRNEAISAGAISVKQGAVFAGDEATAALPGWLRGMSETGFKLYDGADVFTRSVSYHAGKLRAERAIQKFGEALRKGTDTKVAQQALIKDSKAMVLQKSFVDEFLRRVATSPDDAASFLGKQMADITQFLYGRGNQPRWMRSVPGRFIGQFGTWPLWWIDFVRRSFTNMWRNGYQGEATKFIGKIALVDLAIYEAGRRVNLDLRRWMSTNVLFGVPPIAQPPAVNLLYGVSQLARGASEEVLGTYDSPANRQRLGMAQQIIAQAGLAFIPNYYAVRDIGRLMNASSPTEALAAAMATRPTSDFTVQQKLDLLFDPGKMSTDLDLESQGEVVPTATDIMLRGMKMGREQIVVPQGNLPPQPPGATPVPTGTQTGGSSSLRIKGKVEGRPPLEPSALPKSIRTGESTPRLE